MTPYLIAPLAQTDLEEIWRYVARDNPRAADRLLARFRDKFLLLAGQPEMGEWREDLRPNLRAFTAGKYVIYFRPAENEIEIVRVLHSARDVRALF